MGSRRIGLKLRNTTENTPNVLPPVQVSKLSPRSSVTVIEIVA